jgi:hypothetical protein
MIAQTFPLAVRTRHLGRLAGMLRTLVRTVPTVVRPVADIRLEDAFAIIASEVAGLAVHAATRFRLVRLVLAIRGAVTVPRLGHADPAGTALELLFTVAGVWLQNRAAKLVAAVVAVGDAVALVRLVDALFEVGALKLGRGAGLRRTALLVGVVETVIVTVADPGLGNAVTGALAGELEVGAGLLRTRIA